jgi:hypothetical protein
VQSRLTTSQGLCRDLNLSETCFLFLRKYACHRGDNGIVFTVYPRPWDLRGLMWRLMAACFCCEGVTLRESSCEVSGSVDLVWADDLTSYVVAFWEPKVVQEFGRYFACMI